MTQRLVTTGRSLPKPRETAGIQRQLASRDDQESPSNHGQIFVLGSLTENRGVGSSILPLAIA
jgi:hypothetical protein